MRYSTKLLNEALYDLRRTKDIVSANAPDAHLNIINQKIRSIQNDLSYLNSDKKFTVREIKLIRNLTRKGLNSYQISLITGDDKEKIRKIIKYKEAWD